VTSSAASRIELDSDPVVDRPRIDAAIATAADLLRVAADVNAGQPRRERARQRRLAALIGDEAAKELTFALTDQVERIVSRRHAARRFAAVVAEARLDAFSPLDRLALRLGARLAPRMPHAVMPLVLRRLRSESDGVIVAAEDPPFARHVSRRRAEGITPNINVLGEAILSDREAQQRLELVLARLRRPDVDYVSVKISAICPNVSALAFDATAAAVAQRLRQLYSAAAQHSPPKFVNLDMEEYRDLDLTIAVFTSVLAEPEHRAIDAGIVLQAYLPDSRDAARRLCEWARVRRAAGGGRIKVRVVKGANLAMEQVEAELRGWPLATYSTKGEVDASYKLLLDVLLDPANDDAVRVGVASHNLFEIGWALALRAELAARGQASRIDIEMLEGMAPAQAAAVRRLVDSLLLYTPVVSRDDFGAAIAYLVRRLDENTSPDNFLAHVLSLEPGSAEFDRQAQMFTAAVAARATLDTSPRRQQDRHAVAAANRLDTAFRNEPDTDFTSAANRQWVAAAAASVSALTDPPPAVGIADVDAAVAAGRAGAARWQARGLGGRAELINAVGDVIARRRLDVLALMRSECSKTIAEGDPEVSEAVDFARYYAREAVRLHDVATSGAATGEPLGTVVIAPPWNFPFAIPMGGVLAALAAGNSVILKPAPQAVRCAWLVAQCCWEAGIPHDAVQFVRAPDDGAGQRLITHPDVSAVVLTGAHETAQLFLSWRPSLRLHAETSGKNAMVITASADIDAAIRDLVRSAFGHAGQKCSAASLAIVDRALYDDRRFMHRLGDAVRTLRVGAADDLATDVAPLIGAPGAALHRALTTLDAGERWLVAPEAHHDVANLWSPGVRVGVAEGSWFHHAECFGPVLGVMRADDLTHAVRLQNAVAYGLTAGLHALDPAEIEQWLGEVQAGNLYVNRSTTGAIVERQPFGGWKRSAVGPTAKAGGPNYVATLQCWRDGGMPMGEVRRAFERWMAEHGRAEHDVCGLLAERNIFRYRPLMGGVVVRLGADADERALALMQCAAQFAGCRVWWSSADDEDEQQFAGRLAGLPADRLRVVGAAGDTVRAAAHTACISVDESAPVGAPSIEMPRWLHEQAVSITAHRHGHVPRRPRA
jgi:RHH-type transcriptional regulator, proline utilization regulon repressor / proline dehydrogenase / delta 1-pyrroline-5-carboxylate dehydrogenase